ncbi:HesA/MoeB/ThiF family protein [Gammaproteobacteria bacterium AB-CW1]|uniref:HesA/MoeB/ThiF family protein n=2 Tax=Natronospira TaxID=2024969 RepID=A0AAP6JJN4_9GAMM|nr:HesA/MoeB/ThiF family protein [Gammaproteobacteria bacterium AB-CW1]
MTDLARYDRQMVLPEVGEAGQRRLAQARVLCIGAGGLGSAVLPYLAGAGIGRLTVIDDDRVEASNLQRQVLFREADQQRPKVEAAVDALRALNSGIEIVGENGRLDRDNVQRLFEDHDVIVDGSDNFDTKFLAADAAVKFGVPLVYGSVTGFEAQVTVFDPDHGPCLRCLFPSPPTSWVPNCAEAGVLGPLVGMAGSLQAMQVIQLIVSQALPGRLEPLIGRLWTLDARSMDSHCLRIRKRPDCGLCSLDPAAVELPRPSRDPGQDIAPNEASQLDDALFLDIREPDEWAAGHIPGAENLPLSRLLEGERPARLGERPCVVYCTRGTRGETAARLLAEEGHPRIHNLLGGLAAWPGPRRQTDR